MRSYLHVLATPGAWRFLAPALIARLPFAMLQMGVLLLVQWSTGSYGQAGFATAAAAVSQALAGPQTGRLADRYGQARVLVPQSAVHGLALGALLVLASAHASLPLLVLTAALVGASAPQVGAMVRARWAHRLRGASTLDTAFAVESITDELTFAFAPVLLVALATGFSPVVALLAALALSVVGTLLFAAVRTGAPEPRPAGPRSSGGVLGLRGVALVAAAFVAMGSVFGSLQVGVTSMTAELGRPGLAGAVYGTLAVASAAGGFLYGAVRWKAGAPARLATGLPLLGVATSAFIFAGNVPLLYCAAALAGFVIAPVLITGFTIVEGLVPDGVRTEAFTWLIGANGLGIAAGSLAAGQLVDRFGAATAFLVPPVTIGMVALLLLVRLRSLRPPVRATVDRERVPL
ncbi:MFS transporter [Microtetraspora niveoalba]|uniref:MFS transporter n=1 Tax=Microtetraspora niveoalba TaxID=46175 RepID=UPI000835CAA7|nr:MFS transporter [Microtetraspora niveoalba]